MSDRRAHQCHRDGCDTAAQWRLMLKLSTPAWPSFTCESTIAVCDRHTGDACQYLLSDTNKSRIAQALFREGLGLPQFDRAEPVLVPIPQTVSH